MNVHNIHLSYKYLLEYYLRNQTTGLLADFNKTYFPENYKDMCKQLEEIGCERDDRNKGGKKV